MTHFLLAALVTSPLHAGLSLPVIVVANVVLIPNTTGTAVHGTDDTPYAPLPLENPIQAANAANAHGAGRA